MNLYLGVSTFFSIVWFGASAYHILHGNYVLGLLCLVLANQIFILMNQNDV